MNEVNDAKAPVERWEIDALLEALGNIPGSIQHHYPDSAKYVECYMRERGVCGSIIRLGETLAPMVSASFVSSPYKIPR